MFGKTELSVAIKCFYVIMGIIKTIRDLIYSGVYICTVRRIK